MNLEDIYCFARKPKNPDDFWELNEELSYIEPFSNFVEEENSAKIMTGIYMLYDPKAAIQNSGQSPDDIKKDIAKNFFGDENFPWRNYAKYIRAYQRFCKTKIEKELDDWFYAIQERKQYMAEFAWDEDPELKEKMLLKNDQHFNKYLEIRSQLQEERVEMLMHGNYTPSMLESTKVSG